MSPSAAAPSSASVMACERMSASEWPSRPNSLGIVTPPRISGAARRQAMHVPAEAGANLAITTPSRRRHLFGQKQPRQFHVGRPGDLDVAVAALHHAHFHLFQALHQAGFVGAGEAVARARSRRRASADRSGTPAESAPAPDARAAAWRESCSLHPLHRVHRHDARRSPRRSAAASAITCSTSSESMNGRTASCTATSSVSGRQRRQRILDRLLPAIRRPRPSAPASQDAPDESGRAPSPYPRRAAPPRSR